MSSDTLKRIEQLRAQVGKNLKDTKEKQYNSYFQKASRQWIDIHLFMVQAFVGMCWIWSKIQPWLGPVGRFVYNWIFQPYYRLWNKFVFVKNNYGGTDFSKSRSGIMLLATGLFLWYGLDLILDTAVYFATVKRNEEIILLSSQEIGSKDNLHNIEGCYNLPCSDTDAVYFRVRNGLFNNLWNFAHWKGLFFPERIAAPVASGYNRCIITAYGVRIYWFVHETNWFPEVLEIKACIPAIIQK